MYSNQTIEIDCLTGYVIVPGTGDYNPNFDGYDYYSKPVGRVKISGSAYVDIQGLDSLKKLNLAGICRNCFETGQEPPFILNGTIETILNTYDIPESFEEKKVKILEYLISKGGKEYKSCELKFDMDFPLIYGNLEEFQRVIRSLKSEGHITGDPSTEGWHNVLPTESGIRLVEEPTPEEVNLSKILSEVERDKIKTLVASAKIKEGLSELENILSEKGKTREVHVIVLLKMELKMVENSAIEGTVTSEESRSGFSKIAKKVLLLMG